MGGWRMTRHFYNFAVMPRFEFAVPARIPDGLTSLDAASCGKCHPDNYAEWKQSIHSISSTDPYFATDRRHEGNRQVCLHCHAPLEQQQERLITGYSDLHKLDSIETPNASYDPVLFTQGVTCAVCHVRDGKIVGPFEPVGAPHPVTVDPSFNHTMTACQRCHSTVIYPGLDAGAAGLDWSRPLPGCGTVEEMAYRDVSQAGNCPGCHMPPVSRPVAVGGPVRDARKHLFLGGHHPEMVRNSIDVRQERVENGDRIRHTVTVENVGTPHFLPTGIPDRKISVEFRLLDAAGDAIQKQTSYLQREVIWKPLIFVWKEDRLPSEVPRAVSFEFDRASPDPPVWLDITVRYQSFGERRRRALGYANADAISYIVYRRRIEAQTGLETSDGTDRVVCSGVVPQLDRVSRETSIVPGMSTVRVDSDACRGGNPDLGLGWPFW
jgi:hypothetical protein